MPPAGFEPTIPASERLLESAHVINTVRKYGRQDITNLKLSETKKNESMRSRRASVLREGRFERKK
jgi:hypothetical protein